MISCGKINFRNKHPDIIPKDKFISILVDIHLADAVLSISSIKKIYTREKSQIYYNQVLEVHGFTITQFNNTIKSYSKKPAKLDKIYEEVLAELSKLEGSIKNVEPSLQKVSIPINNLWNLESKWDLPKDGETNQIQFSIPISNLGTYTVSAKIKMYIDDESNSPRVTAYFWYDDDSKYGFIDFFPSSPIPKNNRLKLHSIFKTITNPKITHLRGWILDHSSREGRWEKHAEVFDIKVEYKPSPAPKANLPK